MVTTPMGISLNVLAYCCKSNASNGPLSREEIHQRPLRRLRRLLRQEVPARYAVAAGVARPAPPHGQGIGAGGGNAMIAHSASSGVAILLPAIISRSSAARSI